MTRVVLLLLALLVLPTTGRAEPGGAQRRGAVTAGRGEAVVPSRGPVAAEVEARRGHVLLVGGGEKPREVLELFLRLAGGPDAPLIVLPTASGEADTGAYYEKLFREEAGARQVRSLPVHRRVDAFRGEFVRAVDGAGGVWFSGGDQTRILACLAGTPLLRAVARLFRRGGVVGGTSAGCACQSDPMLTGEGRVDVVADGAVALAPGLGFLVDVIVDQHFIARRRQNRLLSVVLSDPRRLALGVDEDTAIWVRPSGVLEVLGRGQVTVFDARASAVRRGSPREGLAPWGVHDLRMHLLLAGERFDLRSGRPVPVPSSRRGDVSTGR